MQVLPLADPKALEAALAVLQAGGLVICPTETVYGVLADSENPQAVSKLLAYKRRPAGKAISVAVADQKMAEKYVELNDQARKLYQQFLPGPVTVISQATGLADSRLESEFHTLGIRWPDYDFLQQLIMRLGRGVTATSANAHGRKTPYCLDDISSNLSTKQKNLIDLAIDAGHLPKNPPSLVLDTTTSTPIVMRQNEQIKEFSDSVRLKLISHSPIETQNLSGKVLWPHLEKIWSTGLIITLDGELGAGKTTFTQGLATFLGIEAHVNSPTYTYLKQYPFTKFGHQGTLSHLDVWTLDRPEMITALELEKLFVPRQLVIIEWYEQIARYCQPQIPMLQIKITSEQDNPHNRIILVDNIKNNSDNKE